MRTLALIAVTVASLAACGDAGTGGPYDPASDTTRGMGDAGAFATTDRPEACQPGLLWCGHALGTCTPPDNRDSCGRCGNVCTRTAPRCIPSGSSYTCAP